MMTPLHIELVLHYHAIPEQHPRHNAPAVIKYTRDLLAVGLIEEHSSASGYTTTLRGEAYIRMLLNTPLPEVRYVDPREPIKRELLDTD